MANFLPELPYALLIVGTIITGLYLANIFYDKGVEQYISRKVGHGVGGMGVLLFPFLFSSPWWPIILAAGFTLLLGGARFIKPGTFRGVGGTGRQHALAEVWFPLAGTVVLAVGWGIFNKPLIAVACILMMAWGDMLTGLIRSRFYHREVKGNWGSLGMAAVCLVLAWAFISPLWLGIIGAIVATLTERFTPLSCGWVDDNWTIPIASALTIFGGLYAISSL